MALALLFAYVALPILTWWRVRSLAWTVLVIAAAGGVVGAGLNFAINRGYVFTRDQLQWTLLATLLAVAVSAWISKFRGQTSRARQLVAIALPILVSLIFIGLLTTFWTETPAFLRPVSYLIGQSSAEDNSRWLDFTAQWSSGAGIEQQVPLGGPLQLFLTFVGTGLSAVSAVLLGGVNEVAVAANSVIFGQLLLVAGMGFAFATFAESRVRIGDSQSRIPAPLIWLGVAVVMIAGLAATNHGHLTLQFALLVMVLWCATFLVDSGVPHARVLASVAAAAATTVWLPLNVIALVIVIAWLATYAYRLVRGGARSVDWVGVVLIAVVAIGVLQPLWSSMSYLLFESSAMIVMGAGVMGAAAARVPALADSILFSTGGGTEAVGAVLAILTAVSVLGAVVVMGMRQGTLRLGAYVRFGPLGILGVVALAIYALDAWSTGTAPNYGSQKFTFMVAVVALSVTLPIALMLVDSPVGERMSVGRWVGVGLVLLLLSVDSLLPRAIAQVRPERWSPPIPFNNTSGSYWWPADVKVQPEQPVNQNPIACVYLPEGYPAPTAIVPSGLSDPQRVYACTRQLMGLGGLDSVGQPVVDWLLREWISGQPAWADVYDYLAALPDEVLDRPVILLDDGSNVKGLETLRGLLTRYPKDIALSSPN